MLVFIYILFLAPNKIYQTNDNIYFTVTLQVRQLILLTLT